ncbi:hypothetical protein JXA12_04535 [Candidatus Woesearchaeota archaeon]|nr:hypothetical protein [Candidatus Woesearchaeota archaeon]
MKDDGQHLRGCKGMKGIVRKGFLVGLGVTTLTAGKMEKAIKEFLKEHDINKAEAEQAAKAFLTDVKRHQERAIDALQREMKKAEQHLKRHAAKARKGAAKKRRATKKQAAMKQELREQG